MQIRIGTRKSKLAIWQAELLLQSIHDLGLKAELVYIDSMGDLDKTSDLRAMNQTGIFTKSLDKALLAQEIDVAIHSLKDYPTVPPPGICIKSFGERANPKDVIVNNVIEKSISEDRFRIGTGSIRRQAQWKYKYPNTEFVPLRGNVPTRLEKLWDSDWDGIILAHAGLQRLNKIDEHCVTLDWMIPAPSQGILGISYRKDDAFLTKLSEQLSDGETEICAMVERKFLNLLEGGCSAPIGALATIRNENLIFKGCLHDPDGKAAYYVNETIAKEHALEWVEEWVNQIRTQGGDLILEKIKSQ